MLCFDKIKCCTIQYQIDTVLYLFTSINKINQSRDPCNVVWMYDTDSVKLLCNLQVLVSSLGKYRHTYIVEQVCIFFTLRAF